MLEEDALLGIKWCKDSNRYSVLWCVGNIKKKTESRVIKCVVVQKVDLDTALTAFLHGVSERDEIIVVAEKASDEQLENPSTICIECGGSGQTKLNNFDHHDTDKALPPACVQAFRSRYRHESHERLARLVQYVSALDTRGPELLKEQSRLPEGAFPTLSGIFSGMLLLVKDPKERLLRGIEICATVVAQGLNPYSLMPELPQWEAYIEAKRKNDEAIRQALVDARRFETGEGLRAGFVETDVIGALGALYELGCQVAIAYSPKFGNPPVPKYTVAGKGIRVDSLLKVLNDKDPGWGGPAHGTIIGSPRAGSKLTPEQIIEVVREHL